MAPDPLTNTSKPPRNMVRADLLGDHTHRSSNGVEVHIWRRGGRFLARGSYEGQRFGSGLGDNAEEAAALLRRLIVEIENGTFIRPSEARKRPLKRGLPPVLTVRELCDALLTETRKTRGKQTASNYRDRLVPLIEFAEAPTVRRAWPYADRLDRDFVLAFRQQLLMRKVTRNGRSASKAKLISPGHAYNILDTCRTLVNWARRPQVHLLPAAYFNPFSEDLVGRRPAKDPLRRVVFPLERRVQLVQHMDLWQLSHLALVLILPLRPEDFTGLLISEVDLDCCEIACGTRFGGRDFGKGRRSFVSPFPTAVIPLLRVCIGNRTAGPLLQSRDVFEGRRNPCTIVHTKVDVESHVEQVLASASPDDIQCPNDQKRLVRRVLRELGGLSGDSLYKEFKALFHSSIPENIRPYDLRGSITTELDRVPISRHIQLYVTGHAIPDILGEYVCLDPAQEMSRYFATLDPLFKAMAARAAQLGIRGFDTAKQECNVLASSNGQS